MARTEIHMPTYPAAADISAPVMNVAAVHAAIPNVEMPSDGGGRVR